MIFIGQGYNADKVKTKHFARFGPIIGMISCLILVSLRNNQIVSQRGLILGMALLLALIVSAMIVNER